MTATILQLTSSDFAFISPRLVDIYIDAMGYQPSVRHERVNAWRRDAMNPGFAAVVATVDTKIAGFAYGFLGAPDKNWDKQVRRGLFDPARGSQAPLGVDPRELITDYFELAEIHVSPSMQGAQIGVQLLTSLSGLASAKYMLLSTPEVHDEDNRAFRLYRRFGFFDVLRSFHFMGDSRPFAVLGAALPLSQVSNRIPSPDAGKVS